MLIDNLTKLNRSSRNAVSAGLIVIAAVAMFNWTVAPQATYLFAAQRYESVAGNIVKKNKIISNKVIIKRKKLQELQEQFAQLRDTLFTPEQAKEFFSDLQVISEEASCAVYSLNLVTSKAASERKGSADASGIFPESATLSVAGVYENIMKLVKRLQARTQKVWIDSVRMEIFNYDSAQSKFDITITIYTIRDREPAV